MSLYANGHHFRLAVRCCPPIGELPPVVTVQMAGSTDLFVYVTGKVDTGAFRTMLTFDTARRLGIEDPAQTSLGTGTARTATGEPIAYYVHIVSVRASEGTKQPIEFPLKAAFADRIQRNLFGVDWLAHLCLAVDSAAVHFLRD
jgi:hypothetical protein